MSTQNLEEIVDMLSNLKVSALAELKKMLEDKWGVTAAAPMAMVAAAPQADAGAAAPESTDFQVTLESVPSDKKIGVIKAVREITGLGLKEAKELVESAPKVLKETAPKAEADEIAKKIEAAGAKATLKGL